MFFPYEIVKFQLFGGFLSSAFYGKSIKLSRDKIRVKLVKEDPVPEVKLTEYIYIYNIYIYIYIYRAGVFIVEWNPESKSMKTSSKLLKELDERLESYPKFPESLNHLLDDVNIGYINIYIYIY